MSTLATYPAIDWTEDERSWSVLVAQIAKGNQDALTELYDSTNRMVYGLALRILGDSCSAEEVLFEVYLQVWRTAKSFDAGRGKVTSWLVAIARSRSIDALRARQARGAMLRSHWMTHPICGIYEAGPRGTAFRRHERRLFRSLSHNCPKTSGTRSN